MVVKREWKMSQIPHEWFQSQHGSLSPTTIENDMRDKEVHYTRPTYPISTTSIAICYWVQSKPPPPPHTLDCSSLWPTPRRHPYVSHACLVYITASFILGMANDLYSICYMYVYYMYVYKCFVACSLPGKFCLSRPESTNYPLFLFR